MQNKIFSVPFHLIFLKSQGMQVYPPHGAYENKYIEQCKKKFINYYLLKSIVCNLSLNGTYDNFKVLLYFKVYSTFGFIIQSY